MGYTHYWNNRSRDEAAYQKGLEDVRKIVRGSPVPLADGMGTPGSSPELSGRVWFNGVGPDNDHETFGLPAEPTSGFEFCKTAYKPYDLVVVACLATMKETLGADFAVSSDGEPCDWEAGCEFATRILGRPIPIPSLEDSTTDR